LWREIDPVAGGMLTEIPLYLKHGINAFIANPNDIDDFANQIDFVLKNYEESLKVGKQGRILAEETFNYRKYGTKIDEFLNDLLNHKS